MLYLPSPPFIKGPILYPGVHLTFLVSYSGEYQEMAFGMHLTHRPTRYIWSYESYPVSQRRLHSVCTAVFFVPPFFCTAAAWPRSVWISHKRSVAISWFFMCAVHSAHSTHEHTFQCTYTLILSHGTSWHQKKNIFLLRPVCLFFAGGR